MPSGPALSSFMSLGLRGEATREPVVMQTERTRSSAERPPFNHVSWREGERHDADQDMAAYAETVIGEERPDRDGRVGMPYLVKLARYPWWTVSVRALVGAAIAAVVTFLYGSARYHYIGGTGDHRVLRPEALLDGVTLAILGAVAGTFVGATWGLVVVRAVRRRLREWRRPVRSRP